MRNILRAGIFALTFGLLFVGADSVNAQRRNRDVREARQDYRQQTREARREYRDDMRDARREYRRDTGRRVNQGDWNRGRTDNTWNRGRSNNNRRYYYNGRWYYRNN